MKDQRNRSKSGGLSRKWGWAIVALGIAAGIYILFRPAATRQPTADADPGTIAQGAELYAQNCATCHGPGAVGEDPASPMGGTKPAGGYLAPALNGTGHAWHHPPDMLFKVIRDGSPAKDSAMQGWAGKMDDTEIQAVIAYFRSLWPQKIRNGYRQRHGEG